MAAFQINGKWYDPALEQLGDGTSPATAYGFAGGKWRTNIYKLFADYLAEIASLVVGTINASNIFGHDVLSSATTITLSNSNKRSVAFTLTAAGQGIRLPNATTIAKGERWLLRNAGATHPGGLQNNSGGSLGVNIAAGEELELQCEDNSSANGTWRILQQTTARKVALSADPPTALAALGITNLGIADRIINGSMMVDQRFEGNATGAISSTSYTLDRFRAVSTGAGQFQVQKLSDTPPPGYRDYLRVDVMTADASLSASDTYSVQHCIEGFRVSDLGLGTAQAGSITLFFWARSNLVGTFGAALQNHASAAQDRCYPFTYTINQANTWELKTVNVQMDTTGVWYNDDRAGVRIVWTMGHGSDFSDTANAWTGNLNKQGTSGDTNVMASNTNTWDLGGVRLFKGTLTIEPPREPLDYGRTLWDCQRYYAKTFNIGVKPVDLGNVGGAGGLPCVSANTIALHALWKFPRTMRSAVPTITRYNTGNTGSSGAWWDTTSGGALNSNPASLISARSAYFTSAGAPGNTNNVWAIAATADAEIT
jgi:hypothetical protein